MSSGSKTKRVLLLTDEKTILAVGSLYEKQLRETEDLPSQCFTLRIFRELYNFVRCVTRIEEIFLDVSKLEFIEDEVKRFLRAIDTEGLHGIFSDQDLGNLIDDCDELDFELGNVLKLFRYYSRGKEVEKIRERLIKILTSRDSDEDILRQVHSCAKSAEDMSNEISCNRRITVRLLCQYKRLKFDLLSYAEEN